jgi:hypothetical protein
MFSAKAEILALTYSGDTLSALERIKLRKTREVTSVPPMSLEGRHPAIIMPRNT